jgi:hypothetical protein
MFSLLSILILAQFLIDLFKYFKINETTNRIGIVKIRPLIFPEIIIKKIIENVINNSLSNIINDLTIVTEKIFTSLKVMLKILDIPFLTKNRNS